MTAHTFDRRTGDIGLSKKAIETDAGILDQTVREIHRKRRTQLSDQHEMTVRMIRKTVHELLDMFLAQFGQVLVQTTASTGLQSPEQIGFLLIPKKVLRGDVFTLCELLLPIKLPFQN